MFYKNIKQVVCLNPRSKTDEILSIQHRGCFFGIGIAHRLFRTQRMSSYLEVFRHSSPIKKYSVIILLTIIICIFSSQFIVQKTQAQSGYGYPAIIEGVQPWVKFWVTTDLYAPGSSSTLSVKDNSTITITNGETTTKYNSLELLAEIFQEMKRNNKWYEDLSTGGNAVKQNAEQNKSREFLSKIVSDQQKWIKSGFNNASSSGQGNPAYVSNSSDILAKKDNLFIKDTLTNNPAVDSLDDSISLQVKRSIQSDNSKDSDLSNRLKCTAKEIDSEEPLDWSNWLSLSLQPQCTELGAKDIIDKYIQNAEAVQAENFSQELSYGKGALAYKECKVYKIDASGKKTLERTYMGDSVYDSTAEDTYKLILGELGTFTETVCTIATPGSVTSDQLSSMALTDQKMIEASASLGNGQSKVIEKLEENIKDLQNEYQKVGVLGDVSSTTLAYQKKSVENIGLTYSQLFTEDRYDTIDPSSPYYARLPGSFLIEDEWYEYYDVCDDTRPEYDEDYCDFIWYGF